MTEEPKFQAPPTPPKAPSFDAATPVSPTPAAQSDIPSNNFAASLKISPRIYETKIMAAVLGGCVVVGLLLGMVFFGGKSAPKQALSQADIERGMGVISNMDLRVQLRRCGLAPSASSPCLVYIVNHSRDDRYAEYFFDEAAKLTGRAPYRVRLENSHYAKTRIPPGYIAKIIIPQLR